uniref:WD_REPEATS_REGION domain-containing protein n=1 Tax=Syphacia muris TaxID=451379 RepID=A0A0N5AVU2_9BILA
MSMFIRNNSGLSKLKGRKRGKHLSGGFLKKSKKDFDNEEIVSDDESSSIENSPARIASEDEYEDVQETAFRKAKELLTRVQSEVKDEEGVADEAVVSNKLKEEALSRILTLHRPVADTVTLGDTCLAYRAHRYSTVAVVMSHDDRYLVSCSKDATVVKYDLEEGKKVASLKLHKNDNNYHKGHIYAIAISPDDCLLVTGGSDTIIRVWDFRTFQHIKNLSGHKDTITGLCFRIGTRQLFSSSKDRTVKAWDLDQMGYIDTMFGHADAITGIDVLTRCRVLTSGGQDKSLHIWKVMEESQLIFNAYTSSFSIDCCALINEEHFASGSADGSICLWSTFKKKPVCIQKLAHGLSSENHPNWIICLASRRYTDLLASGSNDGYIRFWKIAIDYKSLKALFSFPMAGFINNICFSEDGLELACAVGQEHKDGRWWINKSAKNLVVLITLHEAEQLQ